MLKSKRITSLVIAILGGKNTNYVSNNPNLKFRASYKTNRVELDEVSKLAPKNFGDGSG